MNSYQKNLAIKSDIQEHLGLLHGLAMDCQTIVEFGFRTGVSASAFLAAGAYLTSYDIDKIGTRPHVQALANEYPDTFSFKHANSCNVEIPECDILFIDSDHTEETTAFELERHHSKVTQFIILHDTQTFGLKDRSPGTGKGIMTAVSRFIDQTTPGEDWDMMLHLPNNNGLAILKRVD